MRPRLPCYKPDRCCRPCPDGCGALSETRCTKAKPNTMMTSLPPPAPALVAVLFSRKSRLPPSATRRRPVDSSAAMVKRYLIRDANLHVYYCLLTFSANQSAQTTHLTPSGSMLSPCHSVHLSLEARKHSNLPSCVAGACCVIRSSIIFSALSVEACKLARASTSNSPSHLNGLVIKIVPEA